MPSHAKQKSRSIRQAIIIILLSCVGYWLWSLYVIGKVSLHFVRPDNSATATFSASVALTEAERAKGLMYVKPEDFGKHDAMLFVFESEAPRSFYMKNTLVPLDVVFLNRQKVVVATKEQLVPLDPVPVASGASAAYALELRAGTVKTEKITLGSQLVGY